MSKLFSQRVGSSVTSEGDWDSVASLVGPMQNHTLLGGRGIAQTLEMCSLRAHWQWVASVSRCLSVSLILFVVSRISGLMPPDAVCPDRAEIAAAL